MNDVVLPNFLTFGAGAVSKVTDHLKSIKCNYPRFKTLLNNKPEKIQYSKGVKVLAWGKNRIEK